MLLLVLLGFSLIPLKNNVAHTLMTTLYLHCRRSSSQLICFNSRRSPSAKGFTACSLLVRSKSKVAFVVKAAERCLSMLWSVHLPHDDGGGPVAFAGESSILTSVGVFPQQASCLRMRRAKKYLASFILLGTSKNAENAIS